MLMCIYIYIYIYFIGLVNYDLSDCDLFFVNVVTLEMLFCEKGDFGATKPGTNLPFFRLHSGR